MYYCLTVPVADGTPNTQINKIVCHPTLPIVISAHEDKYIRMYDSNTGESLKKRGGYIHVVWCFFFPDAFQVKWSILWPLTWTLCRVWLLTHMDCTYYQEVCSQATLSFHFCLSSIMCPLLSHLSHLSSPPTPHNHTSTHPLSNHLTSLFQHSFFHHIRSRWFFTILEHGLKDVYSGAHCTP